MLDPNLLRNEPDAVAEKLARRGFKLDVDTLRSLEERRKVLQVETENLQAERNSRSKSIGQAKARGEDIEPLRQEVNALGERRMRRKQSWIPCRTKFVTLRSRCRTCRPMKCRWVKMTAKEVSRWGQPRQFDFPVKDHVELGEAVKGLDFASAVKLTGSRFIVMQGQIARLHRALSQFMIDLHSQQHGYLETYVPYLVNHETLYGTGQLPKFGEDLFHTKPLGEKQAAVTMR